MWWCSPQTYIDWPWQVGVGPTAGGQRGGIQPIPASDQNTQFMAADRVVPGDVTDARTVGFGKLQDRGRQVGDVDRTAHVVGEQHPSDLPGGEGMHQRSWNESPSPTINEVRTMTAVGSMALIAVSAAALAAR